MIGGGGGDGRSVWISGYESYDIIMHYAGLCLKCEKIVRKIIDTEVRWSGSAASVINLPAGDP